MKISNYSFVVAAIILLSFGSCRKLNKNNNVDVSGNNEISQTQGIFNPEKVVAPPFEGVNIPVETYTVSGEKSSTLSLPNGTTITIPANAFVKEDGSPVTGEIILTYREFHKTADLILSGIKMSDINESSYLETAGMFEMNGMQGSESVKIAPNKPLLVNLVSYADNSKTYDKWVLDTNTGKWINIGTCHSAAPNTTKLTKLNALEAELGQKPLQPSALSNSKPVFDLEVDYKNFPELKAFHGVIWEYAGKDTNDKINWVFDTDWSKINLTQGSETGVYNLNLSNKNKTFSTPVRPVLKGNDLALAQSSFSERMDKYNIKFAAQEEARVLLESQSDLRRSMQVNQFGLSNFDCLNKWERILVQVDIDFEGKNNLSDEVKKEIQYFMLMGTRKTALRYWESDLKMFNYPRNESVCILAVLPGNKIATIGVKEFKNLNFLKGENVSIHLHVQPGSITNGDDLQKQLDRLFES